MPEDEEVCAIKCFCFTGGIVMGFFGKLFEKKECSICGGEIGLLGNRKLEDGNMCKNCAAKLSPWFEDRRSSTIAQVNEQLAYREDNKTKVAAFNVTRTLGKNPKVLLDEDAGVFIVTMENDWQAENPDVLSFTEGADGRTVIVRREKICDNCKPMTPTPQNEDEVTLYDFLNSLSPAQQHAAMVHLSVKWAYRQGGPNGGA